MSKEKMTPEEKATKMREARARAAMKKIPVDRPVFNYLPPAEYRPHFISLRVRTEQDGLIASVVEAVRYIGRYDPDAVDKKKRDMLGYDHTTVTNLVARLSAVTFRSNVLKIMPVSPKTRNGKKLNGFRLPPNSEFEIVIRAGLKTDKQDKDVKYLACRITRINQVGKKGKNLVRVELPKTDSVVVNFRRFNQLGTAALQQVKEPPRNVRPQAKV